MYSIANKEATKTELLLSLNWILTVPFLHAHPWPGEDETVLYLQDLEVFPLHHFPRTYYY